VRINDTTGQPLVSLVCCGLIGTVVVDDGLLERSYAEAIATQGVVSGTSAYARRMAQVHQFRGQAPGDVLRALFPDNEARAQAAHLAFDRAVFDAVSRAGLRLVTGAAQVLEKLRAAGCRVCVITVLPQRVLEAVLEAAGLRTSIDLALSRADAPRGFPAPDLVLTAMLSSGADSVTDVAVVHSTGAGVEAGRRSGAGLVAGVLTGPHGAGRLEQAGAARVLASIADLPGLLSPDGPARPAGSPLAPDSAAAAGSAVPTNSGLPARARQIRKPTPSVTTPNRR
jgi:phosphoglycolate phosphatase